MSTNNTFSLTRFKLLYKQQLLQNSKLLIFGTIGYCGVIMIVVAMATLDNGLRAPEHRIFFPMMSFLAIVFGVLYCGYSFPSLRNKESTISYMTLPASTLEKFTLEFINRILLSILVLPLLFWITYNAGYYFISLIFQSFEFEFFGTAVMQEELKNTMERPKVITMFISIFTLFLVIPFTGAAFFGKQPLIKTLFSVASIVIAYICLIYIAVEPLGLGNYLIDETISLVPTENDEILTFFIVVINITNLTMLTVAYLKLKEKEV